jgi:4'-phosphopantetheinyl transferase
LGEGEVQVWCFSLDAEESDLEAAWQVLASEERARAMQLPRGGPQERFALARAAVRRLLAHHQQVSPHAVRFSYGEHGKPFVEGLELSLSHAEAQLLVAVSAAGPLGVDLERNRPFAGLERMVEHFFAPPERAFVLGCGQPEQTRRFLSLWTRKEAYLKAVGLGLSVSPAGINVLDLENGSPHLESSDRRTERFRLLDLELGEHLTGALALSSRIATITRVQGIP